MPVIPTSARQNEGIPQLLQAIHEVATGRYVCKPYRTKIGSRRLTGAVNELTRRIAAQFPGLSNARWVAWRLLEGDAQIVSAIKTGQLMNLVDTAPVQPAEVRPAIGGTG